ncbi:Acetyl-coenzyme A synthetase [Actinidia chinensis var. chinensis]|uniref:Acetyl-coenzyme A synthetase n=1 Tax=Actinidia chinensis var. chinensis TaxID=1590841 RepID=A0A2R6RMX7_ACTCC|nr:Acetyl-coenzyme A synthetase [Actinidia chinensis var. chinensis]
MNYDPCFPDQPVVDQYLPIWASLPSFRSKPAFISAEDEIKDKKVELNPFFSLFEGIKLDEVYLIQYSSGATGVPKPVLVSAGLASHNVRTARKAYDLHPNSVMTVALSWRGHCSNASLPSYNKLLPSAGLACGEDEEIPILVVDEETHEAVEDVIEGERWVSSPSNARGYLGHPSLTR